MAFHIQLVKEDWISYKRMLNSDDGFRHITVGVFVYTVLIGRDGKED